MIKATKGDAMGESLDEPKKKRKKGSQPDSIRLLKKYIKYCEDVGSVFIEGNDRENIWKQRYDELDKVSCGPF